MIYIHQGCRLKRAVCMPKYWFDKCQYMKRHDFKGRNLQFKTNMQHIYSNDTSIYVKAKSCSTYAIVVIIEKDFPAQISSFWKEKKRRKKEEKKA